MVAFLQSGPAQQTQYYKEIKRLVDEKTAEATRLAGRPAGTPLADPPRARFSGSFTERCCHVLGGGIPPKPHWTVTMAFADQGDTPGRDQFNVLVAMRCGLATKLDYRFLPRYQNDNPAAWRCTICTAPGAVGDVPHLLLHCEGDAPIGKRDNRNGRPESSCLGINTDRADLLRLLLAQWGTAAAVAWRRLPDHLRAALLLGGDAKACTADANADGAGLSAADANALHRLTLPQRAAVTAAAAYMAARLLRRIHRDT